MRPRRDALKISFGSVAPGVAGLLLIAGAACSSGQSGLDGHGGAGASGAATGGASGMQPVSAGGTGTNGGAMNTGGVAGATGGTTTNAGMGGGSDVVEKGTLYVAPTGDDANPGTMARPLRTIAHARDLVRAMTTSMTSDIHVYLRDGTYPITETLT